VEDSLAVLVLVEPEVQEGPQKAAALRTAKAERPLHGLPDAIQRPRGRALSAALEKRYKIANRRHAESDHGRILRAIDDFVDQARLESRCAVDAPSIRHSPPVLLSRKLPLVPRNQPAWPFAEVPFGERSGGVRKIDHGIRQKGAVTE